MKRNRLFYLVMAYFWTTASYFLMHMQDMLALFVMAGVMFVQSLYSIIFDQKSC